MLQADFLQNKTAMIPENHHSPVLEAVPGFEHEDAGLADHCLTTWLHRHIYNMISISHFFEKVNYK